MYVGFLLTGNPLCMSRPVPSILYVHSSLHGWCRILVSQMLRGGLVVQPSRSPNYLAAMNTSIYGSILEVVNEYDVLISCNLFIIPIHLCAALVL